MGHLDHMWHLDLVFGEVGVMPRPESDNVEGASLGENSALPTSYSVPLFTRLRLSSGHFGFSCPRSSFLETVGALSFIFITILFTYHNTHQFKMHSSIVFIYRPVHHYLILEYFITPKRNPVPGEGPGCDPCSRGLTVSPGFTFPCLIA